MSGVGPIVLVLAGVGALCFLALLARLWSIRGQGEAPLGPRQSPRPDAPSPPALPSAFRSLIGTEATRWKNREEWQSVIRQLDDLAEILGAGPAESEPPRKYSPVWLEHRVAQIEMVTGGPASAPPAASPSPPAMTGVPVASAAAPPTDPDVPTENLSTT